jgi:hypothetical protein
MTSTPTAHERPVRRAFGAVTLLGALIVGLLAVALVLVATGTSDSLGIPVGIALLVVTITAAILQRITSAG